MRMTPLHVSIQQDHIKCVGLLLQYGSDLHSTFAEYPTVVAFARYHGNPDIMRLLHAFLVDRGMGHHQPAQNYNAIVLVSFELIELSSANKVSV
jgi:ankyrin repeat protein